MILYILGSYFPYLLSHVTPVLLTAILDRIILHFVPDTILSSNLSRSGSA
ncbi:hypothetical protein VCHA54P489_160002 [Vibrio chagasii]|nr:hypothetical protein VCHA54P489_160002 [Vibrio chagasii]CAH7011954.1 hypothetical protein VCHA37P202_150002 [Vibrio chagasii]CAH7040372.1 hypothetical protein VCHA49P380_170142 [Vibrio chagasii]